MEDSTNGKKPTGTPKIQKPYSSVKKPRGSDIDMEIRLHTSLTTLKVLMLQILLVILKKKTHILGKTNYVHIIC